MQSIPQVVASAMRAHWTPNFPLRWGWIIPARVIARLFKIVEAYDCCYGLKRKIIIRLMVLTTDYLMSDNKPNPSAHRGKQACLMLVCSYHAIGNVVFKSCGERISMKTSAISSYIYRQLNWHSLRRCRPLCLQMGECSWKGPPSRFCSVQTEALRVRWAGDYHLNIQEGTCYWPASEIKRPQLLLGQQERRKHHHDQAPKEKSSVTVKKLALNAKPSQCDQWIY